MQISKITVGKKYGMLTAIDKTYPLGGKTSFIMKCDCGKIKTIRTGDILSGRTKSCGCYRRHFYEEKQNNPNYRHGFGSSYNPFYRVFLGIRQRCENANNNSFIDYGCRGISCEWISFVSFKNDMYESYLEHSKSHNGDTTIERIDNEGNYCKDNCKWITKGEQSLNKRSSRILKIFGEEKTLSQWSDKYGVGTTVISRRIEHGWELEDAVKLPPRKGKYKRKEQFPESF